MSDNVKIVIVGTIFTLILCFAMVGFTLIRDYQTDQYCKTTPLDRIDRERCGLDKKN